MTATDEIRARLDELGIEYTDNDEKSVKETCWPYMGELMAVFAEYDNGTTRFACDTWCFTPEQAIAATVGAGTCEPWDMRSNHAVQAANEQKVDERNTVPVTKYLMALDEAREASKDAERWERIARDRKSMCESLKETNADMRRIIKRIKEDK